MCGIAFCNSDKIDTNSVTKKIISNIKHRGPDNEGILHFDNFTFGSCRLSIFDLSENGNMPMVDKSGRYVIVFNGEIYNFRELKKRFKIKTKTNTDTEVLLELYILKKEFCLEFINGIFSFIIFDKKDKSIFCARDHVGVKPFYYIQDDENFIVSSELRPLVEIKKTSFNLSEIKSYLITSFYDYGENTFYKDIKQLQPGHYIKYYIDERKFSIKKYWDLKTFANDTNLKEEEQLIDEGFNLFKNAFKLQINADVQIGLNLSSGIDSQMMLHFIDSINGGQKNIIANSFFYKENQFNEKPELEKIANSINWKVNFFEITSDDIINNFDKTLNFQEGPFPGVPTIAKSLLIQRAYSQNQKVVLEAQGGDDIAGGYRYIYGGYMFDLIRKKKFIKIISELYQFKKMENESLSSTIKLILQSFKAINGGGISADGSANINLKVFNKNFFKITDKKNEIFEAISPIKSYLNKIIYRDIFYTKLQRILKSCDRASMMHSKELRVPILDKNIVEFFYKLDPKYKIKNGNLRYLYRMIFQKKFNQNGFTKKIYVSDPQVKWLKNELFDWAFQILADKDTYHDGIYNTKNLLNHFENFRKDDSIKNSNMFWQALCLKRMLKNSKADRYF